MKLIVLLCSLLVAVFAKDFPLESEEFLETDYEDIAVQGWLLGKSAKSAVNDALAQLPCGFPDAGIPPLAPYCNEEFSLNYNRSFVSTSAKFERFRLDGLDNMDINSLKVDFWIKKKGSFDFTWPLLSVKATKWESKAVLDLLQSYGMRIGYESLGQLYFALKNLRVSASFRYKAPVLLGSAKIYNFRLHRLSVDDIVSEIDGFLGQGKINHIVNQQIEKLVMEIISRSEDDIENLINKELVPLVNAELKGKKVWNLIFSSKPTKCVSPPPAPF